MARFGPVICGWPDITKFKFIRSTASDALKNKK